jgi:nucleoside diphosphate kinase
VRALAVRAEISYVMVKPDGVQRGLVGDIISRFERKGFKLVGLKLYQTPKDVAEEHYKELSSKPFYSKLVEYIVSGPVVAMVSTVAVVTFKHDTCGVDLLVAVLSAYRGCTAVC